jgi:hypothetical protein
MKKLREIIRSIGLLLGGVLVVAGLGLLVASLKASSRPRQRFGSA